MTYRHHCRITRGEIAFRLNGTANRLRKTDSGKRAIAYCRLKDVVENRKEILAENTGKIYFILNKVNLKTEKDRDIAHVNAIAFFHLPAREGGLHSHSPKLLACGLFCNITKKRSPPFSLLCALRVFAVHPKKLPSPLGERGSSCEVTPVNLQTLLQLTPSPWYLTCASSHHRPHRLN